jgi:hypothetical protein
MDHLFIFEFVNEETSNVNILGFYIKPDIYINNDSYLEEVGFYQFTKENEERYGIHDVNFSDPVFFGFTSYEIVENEQFECLDSIKEFFVELGCKCSDITNFTNEEIYGK